MGADLPVSKNRAGLVLNSALAGELDVAAGIHTTVAASDTIDTGLSEVLYAVAQLEDDPIAAVDRALAAIGDQAGTPAKGSILIKTFKPTATADTAPIAATTFSRDVSWIAFGRK